MRVSQNHRKGKENKNAGASALDDVKFEGISKILDVGCGTGVVGFDLLNLIPSAQLFGLDIALSVTRVAKEKIPNGRKGNFITGNAYELPFAESAFDLVACQYVLQHLSQPVHALSEMRRVSHVGAQAVIFEFDDRTGFTYPPAPDELQEMFQAKIELMERKGGDRSIGRKLYHLLRLAGWTEIEIKIIPDIWEGAADRKNALESAYLSFTQLKPQLIAEKLISEKTFDNGLKQLYDYYQSEMFSVLFFFAAFAQNSG